jgi:hypothetical protein
MSKFKTKFQYVSWHGNDIESLHKAIRKSKKLEKQGYILKPNTISMGNLLIYVNFNYSKGE